MQYRVVVERDRCGYYVVEVPQLDGCFTQGRTLEEAIHNILEAMSLYFPESHEPIPLELEIRYRYGITTLFLNFFYWLRAHLRKGKPHSIA